MALSQEYMNAYGGTVQGYSPEVADAQGQPIKQYVHHTYIWLGTLRVAFIIFIAVLISTGSSLIESFASGDFDTTQGQHILSIILLTIIVAYVAFVALMLLYQKVSYKHLYFTLEPTEFSLYSGIFNKKRVHIPYTRVQSVDQKASLLQRILGVCTVQIDTAGGASNKAVMVPYVTKAQAIWLRSELFLRKQAAAEGVDVEQLRSVSSLGAVAGAVPDGHDSTQTASADAVQNVQVGSADNVLEVGNQVWNEFGGGIFGGTAYDGGKVTCEYGLSNKELVFTGLSNNAGFVAAIAVAIVAVLQILGTVFQLFPDQSEWIVDSVYKSAQAITFASAVFVIIGVLVMMLIIWAVSVLFTLINFGGFRARRRGSRIEVERGLLQHVYTGVDIDRVQAVVIKQTFIRRLIGYCELSLSKIDAASSEDDSQNSNLNQHGLVIHPFLKLSRVEEVLSGIVPEYDGAPKEIKPVAKVALRRAIIRQCIWQGGGFWLAVFVAIVHIVLSAMWLSTPGIDIEIVDSVCSAFYIIAAFAVVMEAINAVLWAREAGFAYNRDFVRILNGGFGRTTVDILRRKIQFASTRTNPLQRMAHTATISIRTAAGIGGTTIKLIDARAQDAEECLEWLKPRH